MQTHQSNAATPCRGTVQAIDYVAGGTLVVENGSGRVLRCDRAHVGELLDKLLPGDDIRFGIDEVHGGVSQLVLTRRRMRVAP